VITLQITGGCWLDAGCFVSSIRHFPSVGYTAMLGKNKANVTLPVNWTNLFHLYYQKIVGVNSLWIITNTLLWKYQTVTGWEKKKDGWRYDNPFVIAVCRTVSKSSYEVLRHEKKTQVLPIVSSLCAKTVLIICVSVKPWDGRWNE